MFIEDEERPLKITFIEGDWGIILPIELIPEDKETITNNDSFTINIFSKINTEPLITKTYSNIENNIINFQLSKEDSERLPVGIYRYDLDWYQNNSFLCNLVAKQILHVKEKAGAVNEN